jgi:hypothetical protein
VSTGRRLLACVGLDAALVIAVVICLGPIVSADSAQPGSRIALTAALVEHRSVDITPYRLGIDHSVYHGLRSDKAPGQPVFAIPAYASARAVGAESPTHLRMQGNLTLWWVTLWSATLPFALLLVLVRRTIARTTPKAALPITLAFAGGALILPYAVNLYGHVLAALVGFAAWSVLEADPHDRRRLALGGLLAGAAVFIEYETAVIALVLLVFVLARARDRAPFFALGALPGAIAFAVYHSVAFGAPWHLPYSTYVLKLEGKVDTGLHNPLPGLVDIVAGQRGLLITAPLVLVAVYAAWTALRGPNGRVRTHAVVGLAVFGGYLLGVATFAASDLAQVPGPRFVIPALPFLMVPLATVWTRLRRLIVASALWGTALMVIATYTSVVLDYHGTILGNFRAKLADRRFAPILWSMGLGRLGVVLYAATLLAAIALVVTVARRPSQLRVDRVGSSVS